MLSPSSPGIIRPPDRGFAATPVSRAAALGALGVLLPSASSAMGLLSDPCLLCARSRRILSTQEPPMDAAAIVLTTWPSDRDPADLARALVGERLAACVNVLAGVRFDLSLAAGHRRGRRVSAAGQDDDRPSRGARSAAPRAAPVRRAGVPRAVGGGRKRGVPAVGGGVRGFPVTPTVGSTDTRALAGLKACATRVTRDPGPARGRRSGRRCPRSRPRSARGRR